MSSREEAEENGKKDEAERRGKKTKQKEEEKGRSIA
jgi:hypothetical protein